MANAENGTIPTTYITYVDNDLGFYKVRDITTPTHQISYNNRTLNINVGDSIIWENDAEKTTFTIVSDQGLWNDKVGYLRVGSKVNYKFETPGKYTFRLKEYSPRQTIIVNGQTVNPTVNPTVTSTKIIGNKTNVSNVSTNTSVTTPSKIPTNMQNPTTVPFPKLSPVAIASIVIVISSMIITFSIGRNKR